MYGNKNGGDYQFSETRCNLKFNNLENGDQYQTIKLGQMYNEGKLKS